METKQTSSCRGWSIVACAFICDALALGGRSLFAVVLLDWESEFGWSRSHLSSSVSLLHICTAIATPAAGHIVDVFGARNSLALGVGLFAISLALIGTVNETWHLFLFHGFFSGLCLGILNLNIFSAAVMQALPEKQHGKAVGIATSGSTFGQLIVVPIFALGSKAIGWRNSYFLMAGITFLMAPVSWCILVNKKDVAEKSARVSKPGAREGEEDTLKAKFYRCVQNKYFWYLFFSFTICGITTTGFLETHIIAYVVDRGMSKDDGALAFGILSAFNGLGILTAGYLSDRYSRPAILGVIFFVRACCYIVMFAIGNVELLFAFSVVFGLVDYSVVPPVVGLVGRFIGKGAVGFAMGVLLASHSVGAAIGAAIGGISHDISGSYNIPLGVCACLCFVASCLCFKIPEELIRNKDVQTSGNEGGDTQAATGPGAGIELMQKGQI